MNNYPITKSHLDENKNFEKVQSILNNKFDINLQCTNSEFKDKPMTFHYSEEKQNERLELNIIDDGSVIYKYNSYDFRCDNFKNNHEGKHILFSGCSETEGVGANIEKNWSHILYSEIASDSNVSGYYNLGIAGSGYLKIINNILVYIEKFGKPDVIFILFPNIARWTDWVDEGSGYQNIGLDPYNPKPQDLSRASDEKTLMVNLVNFTSSIKLFEKYCQSSNIKLFWSTWDRFDEESYKTLFNNNVVERFVSMDMIEFESLLPRMIVDQKNFDQSEDQIFRRDTHLGQIFHNYFSDKFLTAYKKEVEYANL